MSELRIIPVTFNGKRYVVTNYRMQYDWGQVLYFTDLDLPEAFEARFSNAPTGESVGQIGTNNRIRIPKQFFESGEPIYCYITLHDEVTDGRTVYTTKVPIKPSSERTEEEPEPEEESIITQAITALNSAVDTTTQKAQEATESADRAEQAAEGTEGFAERAEAAQSAAESARDRATQAETSARTSAATASEKASEAISSATTASQSALTAETASESARASATASAESASQASQSADTASGKASDASEYASNANTSAQTASQKASEAAQSASSASQSKTDAITAKTASETAQGLAETARNEAVTAKEDAESARDEAQSIADGITGKVEQIDSNTDRIESLEDDRYKPYVVDTASGSIASFLDGADNIPLKSCIVRVEPVQEGSGDPSPDNVRPISGWTGCEIQRTGKNLFDSSTLLGGAYSDADFNIPSSSSAIYRSIKIFLKAGTYILSTSVNIDVVRTLIDGGFSSSTYGNLRSHTFTSNTDGYVGLTVRRYDRGDWDFATTLQLESGSTATPYEPYTGRTYPITFPSEAGTVYGGLLDVTKGELVVDRAMVDLGTMTWETPISVNPNCFTARDIVSVIKGRDNALCDTYTVLTEPTTSSAINNAADKTLMINKGAGGETGNYSIGTIIVKDSDCAAMTKSEFKTAMNGIMLCYELATPITYHLTPQEITSMLGTNNIWADTGDVSVEYRADTTLYISRLTEPDADMVADANIVSGQYFMVGTDLYKATVNIASGANVIVGTNATKVSLAQALNEINQ